MKRNVCIRMTPETISKIDKFAVALEENNRSRLIEFCINYFLDRVENIKEYNGKKLKGTNLTLLKAAKELHEKELMDNFQDKKFELLVDQIKKAKSEQLAQLAINGESKAKGLELYKRLRGTFIGLTPPTEV